MRAHTEKGKGRTGKPLSVPRPWRREQERRAPKRQSTPEEISRFFGMTKGRIIVTPDEPGQDEPRGDGSTSTAPDAGEPVTTAPGPVEGV